MMIFSEISTETLPSKNPKNNPENWYVTKIFFDNYDILYIVGKVLKSSIQWKYFRYRLRKPYHWKTLKITLKLGMSMEKFK